jgi:hypothetical protein
MGKGWTPPWEVKRRDLTPALKAAWSVVYKREKERENELRGIDAAWKAQWRTKTAAQKAKWRADWIMENTWFGCDKLDPDSRQCHRRKFQKWIKSIYKRVRWLHEHGHEYALLGLERDLCGRNDNSMTLLEQRGVRKEIKELYKDFYKGRMQEAYQEYWYWDHM